MNKKIKSSGSIHLNNMKIINPVIKYDSREVIKLI